MVDFCLSVGKGKGWSGEGLWFGGGIMFRGSMSPCGAEAEVAAFEGHSDCQLCWVFLAALIGHSEGRLSMMVGLGVAGCLLCIGHSDGISAA